MSQDVEQRIRERAYAIWLEKGCPEGCDHEHWFLAEQDVRGASDRVGDTGAAAKDGGRKAPKATAERKPRARKAAVTA